MPLQIGDSFAEYRILRSLGSRGEWARSTSSGIAVAVAASKGYIEYDVKVVDYWPTVAVACGWQHVRMTTTTLSWDVVPVDKPDDFNVVIGQAHFIKTVEDLHEAIVGVSSSLRFGLAFCEASGPRLVRRTGNDPELVELATRNALAIAAGHCFVIFLRDGFPVNILNPVKAVPEVCTIHCATANPVDILVAVTPRGRGIVGVIDGQAPLGVETDRDVADRRDLLRAIGYKL